MEARRGKRRNGGKVRKGRGGKRSPVKWYKRRKGEGGREGRGHGRKKRRMGHEKEEKIMEERGGKRRNGEV